MSSVHLNNEDFEKALYVKSMIETDFDKHYTAAKLAHLAGTNELKLRAAFKLITGEPLYHYRTIILPYLLCGTQIFVLAIFLDINQEISRKLMLPNFRPYSIF